MSYQTPTIREANRRNLALLRALDSHDHDGEVVATSVHGLVVREERREDAPTVVLGTMNAVREWLGYGDECATVVVCGYEVRV